MGLRTSETDHNTVGLGLVQRLPDSVLWGQAWAAAGGGQPTDSDRKGGQNVHILCIDGDALVGNRTYRTVMHDLQEYVFSTAHAAIRRPGTEVGVVARTLLGRIQGAWDALRD